MSESLADTTIELQPDNKIVENGTAIGSEHVKEEESLEKPAQPEIKEATGVYNQGKEDVDIEGGDGEGPKSTSIAETGDGSEDEVDGIMGETVLASGPQSPKVEEEKLGGKKGDHLESNENEQQAQDLGETSSTMTLPYDSTTNETDHSLINPIIRAVTPSSRTSTPPLGSGVPAKKKFSSVNVNQKFLSKAGSPAPVAGAVKIASLNSASPVSIASSSSRLLSTKLTTVPSLKPSTSPKPPGTTSSASSSPWAKPVLPSATSAESTPAVTPATLHQPAPTRARVLGTTTTPTIMGAGLGITASAPKPAWKAVAGESRRTGMGLSRDFPTAMEVQEGKRAAQMAAQAQAAHNQAILQGLNAFTQLDPNSHRWDEEDEEDDVIDFGDGTGEPHEVAHLDQIPREQLNELPVSKSERFAEDFDRSWPRRQQAPVEPPEKRSEGDSRVLFNASSNRLEPSWSRQPPQPIQPTRLMSRPSDPSSRENRPPPADPRRGLDRAPPPHIQGVDADGRMLPPHMAGAPSTEHRPQPGPSVIPNRPAWGAHREPERAPLPHHADQRELPPQSSAFEHSQSPEKPIPHLLPRRSFSSNVAPVPPAPVSSSTLPPAAAASAPVPGVDAQSAEMHTAAEKARLRRLAEEADREAAAERARQKAKELEERLNLKAAGSGQKEDQSNVPPGLAKPPVQIVLATRPKPVPASENVSVTQVSVPPLGLPSRPDAADKAASVPSRVAESSWRSRMQQTMESATAEVKSNPVPTSILPPPSVNGRPSRPTAESFFESQPASEPNVNLPGQDAVQPKKEANFDSMLARIRAAMAQAQAVPATPAANEEKASPEVLPQEPVASSSKTKQPQPTVKASSPPVNVAQPMAAAVKEYFHVTYPEVPRSPPPAWRTYTVKVPKTHPVRSPIPRNRQRAAEGPRTISPKGWVMTFEPSLEFLSPATLSRAELLLPQPVLRRYQRSEPIVSISPRKLEPFEKKGKKKAAHVDTVRRSAEPSESIASAESLLPSAPVMTGFKSQQLRDQRARSDQTLPPSAFTKVPTELEAAPAVVEAPPRKLKSPVKTSAAAKAERDGHFMTNGVGIGIPERGRMAVSEKPGVRFMVSSELEGDSLLEEVNKMSLETMGEGYEKEQERADGEMVTVSGTETPKTPPAMARPTSPSNGVSTPWSKTPLSFPASHSPARSVSQHDRDVIKSVWDPPASSQQSTTAVSKAAPDASTPIYPSLNTPSSAVPPTQQPLPGGMKMSYSNSHAFSSPGGATSNLSATNSFTGIRHSSVPVGAAQAGYGQLGSPQSLASPESVPPPNMMTGLSYNSMSVNPRAPAGSNGFQQGLWSPSAFGTSMATAGYGYNSQAKALEQRSVQGVGMGYSQKGGEQMHYGHSQQGQEYRYPQSAGYGPPLQAQGQHSQGYSNANAPGYGRGVTSPQSPMYGYGGYGAPGSQTRPNQAGSGRFAVAGQQVNGGSAAEFNSAQQGQGAYGGGYPVQQSQGQGGYYGGAMYPASTSTGVAGGYGGHQVVAHGQQGGGAVGRGGMGGGRKMW
ncbi:hypothetical protein IAR55_007107 [Kwoniella newhampshirensis]|uniref:Uncharacterized protein n=1 Tax=Kwoniella newhampshirensis TaxID=1651941 RepID=A0AAW0YD34_9TREE